MDAMAMRGDAGLLVDPPKSVGVACRASHRVRGQEGLEIHRLGGEKRGEVHSKEEEVHARVVLELDVFVEADAVLV